ncbi:MAG: AMP-binding protein [Lachnospiraceae bacterium]|nr:AMP-binding protein [Lachnospiraceae bacterium]
MWDLRQYGNNTLAIDDSGKSISYSMFEEECNLLAKIIGRRCVVFILCENSIGSIIGYVGCVNNKIVPVLLNANLEKTLLNSLIDTYRPEYIWLPKSKEDDFITYDEVYFSWGYSLIRTTVSEDYSINSDLCLLLTTSGSTGSPKFVRQSYDNVLSNAKAIVSYLNIDQSERPITTLPMNYTYGLSIINSHILTGATLLITDKGLMQKEFWKFFSEQGATSFGGVPYTYEMLKRLKFFNMDLPSLRYMTQAGGKITPELHKLFAEYAAVTGKKFIVMYGQCEATARMGYLPAEMSIKKCGSMGIAIPGGTFKVVNTDGQIIEEPYVTGELVYEGDNVTLGYAECIADLAKGDERNKILHTGDMAQFDEDGYYYIVGRKKRFLKIYGNRVNLDEIDRLIKGHFEDVEVACSGIDDHLYIFITKEEFANNVKNYVVSTTKLNQAAFKVIVIDEIPKNDSGKVLYKELNKFFT